MAQPAETVTPEQSAEPTPEPLVAAAPTAPPEAAPEPQSAAGGRPRPRPGRVQTSAPPRPRPVTPPAPQQVAAAPAPDPARAGGPARAASAARAGSPTARPAEPTAGASASPQRLRQQQAAAQGEGTAEATSLPLGDPITGAERDGLKLAVQRCWNVPAGLRDAQELKVTLAAELTAQGEVISTARSGWSTPRSAPDGRFQQAFDAGRRALIRCSPYTDLPRDKYARWRNIEVVFNPEGMVSW